MSMKCRNEYAMMNMNMIFTVSYLITRIIPFLASWQNGRTRKNINLMLNDFLFIINLFLTFQCY